MKNPKASLNFFKQIPIIKELSHQRRIIYIFIYNIHMDPFGDILNRKKNPEALSIRNRDDGRGTRKKKITSPFFIHFFFT